MTNTYKETLTWKVVSIVTAVATIVSLSGVVYLTNVLNAFALGNDHRAVLNKYTGSSAHRVAPVRADE